MNDPRQVKDDLIDVCYKTYGSHSFAAGYLGSMVAMLLEESTVRQRAKYIKMMQETIVGKLKDTQNV